jgi:hypothetical protein
MATANRCWTAHWRAALAPRRWPCSSRSSFLSPGSQLELLKRKRPQCGREKERGKEGRVESEQLCLDRHLVGWSGKVTRRILSHGALLVAHSYDCSGVGAHLAACDVQLNFSYC